MGIPYQRHKPSAVLRKFLDPLDPGSYFDCGRARLHGIDDVLLREAERRGRVPGDDTFQLVATDVGLIFCRPSISFAIAARWSEVTVARPVGDEPVVMNVAWPVHGDLAFTVGKRLGGNIFRRWLQLQMRANRTENEKSSSDVVADEVASAGGAVDERDQTKSSIAVRAGVAALAAGGGTNHTLTHPDDEEPLFETDKQTADRKSVAKESDNSAEPSLAQSKQADRVDVDPVLKAGKSKTVVWHDGQPIDLVEKFQLVDPDLEAKRLNLDRSTDSEQEDGSDVPSAGLFEGPLLRSPGQASPVEKESGRPKNRSGKSRGQKSRRLGKSEDKRKDDDGPILGSKLAKSSETAAVGDDQSKPTKSGSETVDRDSQPKSPPIEHEERKSLTSSKDLKELPAEVDSESSEVLEPGLETDRRDTNSTDELASQTSRPLIADTSNRSASKRAGSNTGAVEGGPTGGASASNDGSAGGEGGGADELVGANQGDRSDGEQDSADRSANRKLSLLELLASDQEDGPIPQTAKLADVAVPIISRDSKDVDVDHQRPAETSKSPGAPEVEDSSWLPPESVGDGSESDVSSGRSSRLVEFPIAMAIVVLVIGTFLSIVVASRFAPSSDEIAGGVGPSGTIDNLRYRVGFEDLDPEEETDSQIRPVGQPPAGPGIGESGLEGQDDDKASDNEAAGTRTAEVEPDDGGPNDTAEAVPATTSKSSIESSIEGKARTDSVLCNSNYSGCVPDVSDVDCEGDGDGPAYIDKPVLVLGTDVYLLDTDSDGNACEPGQPESNGRRTSTP